jgi:hypothetical protein
LGGCSSHDICAGICHGCVALIDLLPGTRGTRPNPAKCTLRGYESLGKTRRQIAALGTPVMFHKEILGHARSGSRVPTASSHWITWVPFPKIIIKITKGNITPTEAFKHELQRFTSEGRGIRLQLSWEPTWRRVDIRAIFRRHSFKGNLVGPVDGFGICLVLLRALL